MAISKKHKEELVSQYTEWMTESRALILTEYIGLSMKQLDDLRSKARDVGGEFHIVKNTLGKVAFKNLSWDLPEDFLEGSTAVGFAFQDAPAMAKIMADFAKASDFLKIKGGYLGNKPVTADEIKSLAELPPLPVMRAQLLGTIMAPASKLVRTLAEPARSLAAVIQAYAEKDTVEAAA